MHATVKRIVLKTPASVGATGQYSALVLAREAMNRAAADALAAKSACLVAQACEAAAVAAKDVAVASAGGVRVSATDTQAKALSLAIDPAAPLTAAIQNPGGYETLNLGVSPMEAAQPGLPGASGAVPAPPAGAQAKFLRGDATWQDVDKDAVGLGSLSDAPQIDARLGAAKGDLIVYQGGADPARLGVGADGQVLTADASQPCGVKWAPGAGLAAWNPGGAFDRTTDAAFTVADTPSNQEAYRPGRPLRFRQNSSQGWQYAQVTAYAAGTVSLAGAPLTAAIGADAGRELSQGDMTRLVTEAFVFHGNFADQADNTLIASDLLAQLVWPRGRAFCTRFAVRPRVDDSGAAQPRVNVRLAGNAVCTANSGAGLAVSDAAWTQTATDLNTAAYAVNPGDSLEVSVDNNASNKDARDLTVIASFVLE